MEPANPVIEPGAKGREHRTRDPEERLDFMRRQLDPEHQAGAGRIQEKLFSKPLVREQSTEGPLHVPLTHHILLCVLCRHGRVRREPEQGDAPSSLPHSLTCGFAFPTRALQAMNSTGRANSLISLKFMTKERHG